MPQTEAPMPETPTESVHQAVSDLFFNYDLEEARRINPRTQEFLGYDEAKLAEIAGDVIDMLRLAGCPNLPTVDGLVADFLARV